MRPAARSSAARLRKLGAYALTLIAVACSYDFDRFEETPGQGQPEGGADALGAGGVDEGGSGGSRPVGAAGSSSAGSDTGGLSGSGGDAVALGGASSAGETGLSAGAGAGAVAGTGAVAGAGSGAGGFGGGAGEGGLGAGGSAGADFDCDALGGTVADGHCYFVLGSDTGQSWTAARAACQSYSSDLVSINSSAEQDLLERAFFPARADHWIGLALADTATQPPPESCADQAGSCPFSWVSGAAVSYTNWAQHLLSDDEPNYSGACARAENDDAEWADLDCSAPLPFVCEREFL